MCKFIKNLFQDVWTLYRKQVVVACIAIVIIVFALLLSGCAGQGQRFETKGNSYCSWADAPGWVAKDFLQGDGWGLMDGRSFIGDNGLPCYILKVDVPPADGSCDVIAVVCETGNTDNRHGPNTPLVIAVGNAPCTAWDGFVESVENLKKKI